MKESTYRVSFIIYIKFLIVKLFLALIRNHTIEMVKFKNNKKIIMKVKKIIKIEKNQFTVSGKIKNCR